MREFTFLLLWIGLLGAPVQAALQIEFDYRYDVEGFFDDPLRRESLAAAGRLVNRYVDDLDAVIPSEGNSSLALVNDPATGSDVLLRDEPVPQGTIVIFAAGRVTARQAGSGD